MQEKWFHRVKVGDHLKPDPMWNATERRPNQLPDPVEVLAVVQAQAQSQSGVLFRVRTFSGITRDLDAGWFIPPRGKKR